MHPDTAVSFNCKLPDTKTLWVEIEHPMGERPQELIDALAEVGFVEDDLRKTPEIEGVPTTVYLSRKGSSLFTLWTDAESVTFEKEARDVLARFGFEDVPVYELTYADLG